jgi:hypothetical protein
MLPATLTNNAPQNDVFHHNDLLPFNATGLLLTPGPMHRGPGSVKKLPG